MSYPYPTPSAPPLFESRTTHVFVPQVPSVGMIQTDHSRPMLAPTGVPYKTMYQPMPVFNPVPSAPPIDFDYRSPENNMPPMPPPSYQSSVASDEQTKLKHFQDVCNKYEINNEFSSKMMAIEGIEIIIIADDSGSMNTPVTSPVNKYATLPTRWDELKYTIGIIVDIAGLVDKNGADIYFLNRPPLRNVSYHNQLDPVFSQIPSGGTPLVQVLQNVLSQKTDSKRLIIIATDGIPDKINGNDGVEMLRKVLLNERGPKDYVTIIACTDDDDVMHYLNKWDKEIPNLDIVDDYYSEKNEILSVQGRNFKFTFGDYVVKILMGSFDPWFDNLDEKKIKTGKKKRSCTII